MLGNPCVINEPKTKINGNKSFDANGKPVRHITRIVYTIIM